MGKLPLLALCGLKGSGNLSTAASMEVAVGKDCPVGRFCLLSLELEETKAQCTVMLKGIVQEIHLHHSHPVMASC